MSRLQNGFALVAMLGLVACGATEKTQDAPTQQTLDRMADTLRVHVEIHENRAEGGCDPRMAAGAPCFISTLTLAMPAALPERGWAMYFSQSDPMAFADSPEFTIERVNGDLNRLTPSAGYQGFRAGETKSIRLLNRGGVMSATKMMPNYYVVADGLEARVVASTRFPIDPQTGLEVQSHIAPIPFDDAHFKLGANDATPRATSAWLFEQNRDVSSDAASIDAELIPTPRSLEHDRGRRTLSIDKGIHAQLDGIAPEQIAAALDRLALLGVTHNTNGVPLRIRVDARLPGAAGTYRVRVGERDIEVVGRDPAGAFYGVQSLAGLLTPGHTQLPRVSIDDEPRYGFRGLHLDVARNFHGTRFVLKLLDQMAAYKLNVLHLHLGDDEGWRLEIPGLPELTQIGAHRCHDPSEDRCLLPQLGAGPEGDTAVNGFFTLADYSEILRAATARHIQVIPSFDMPGHSRAAVKSMEARHRRLQAAGDPQAAAQYLLTDFDDRTVYESIQFYNDNTLNVCMESTYRFVEKVVDEVAKIHAQAGHPLRRYHIGADETAGAWKESPACHTFLSKNDAGISTAEQLGPYFIARVANMLTAKGILPAAWGDGLSHVEPERMPAKVQSNEWGLLSANAHAPAHLHANRGWDIVLSLPEVLYFDFPYAAHPLENGQPWGARYVPTRKVFDFMPDNLPAHAEIWRDIFEQPLALQDRAPLQRGRTFTGIQAQLWSETLRTDAAVEYMLFPRLLALAERAWHRADWEVPYDGNGGTYGVNSSRFSAERRATRDRDWARFASVVGFKELPKLDAAGVAYRVPLVGAVMIDGKLHANLELPGLAIEYRIAGGAWQHYEAPVAVTSKDIELRARAASGERRGRTTAL